MPTAIFDSQIEVMRWLSQYRTSYVNAFFLLVSGAGSTFGYMVLFSILWWGFSWKLGARLLLALVLSIYVNSLIKETVALPRPFVYSDLDSVIEPDEFSFPSGHSQHAAMVWTVLAHRFPKRRFQIFAAAMVFLIGFSRVMLGVHFPTDVLTGWILGWVLAQAYLRWSEPAIDWASQLPFEKGLSLALGVPAILTLLHGSRYSAMSMGGLAGALAGLAIARRQHLYRDKTEAPVRKERLIVGLIGLPLLYLALLYLSPGEGSSFYYLFLWMRFAAIGLWVSFLVPRIVAAVRRS